MTASAYPQPTIQKYLSELSDYRVELTDEVIPVPEMELSLPVDTPLLDEYVLRSYSRWSIVPPDSPTSRFSLDVYEMLDPWGAYGLFSIWPEISPPFSGKRLTLSVDNYIDGNSLVFWRGSYFFHLAADLSGPDEEVFRRTAHDLLEEIDLLNLHPLTVLLLPKTDLIRETLRYYLGGASFRLSEGFPASLKPHLGLDRDVEITEARYLPGRHALFLIAYPTPELAAHFYLELQKAMTSYFSPEGIYIKRAGVVVGIFFGPEERAYAVLEKVQYAPTIKWLYIEEELPPDLRATAGTVLVVVRRTLILISGFLLLSLGGGFALGMLRYQTFRRFAGKLPREEIVLLKLD